MRLAPGFPCALCLRGAKNLQNSGEMSRENEIVWHSVIPGRLAEPNYGAHWRT